jgi:hypothetical protein
MSETRGGLIQEECLRKTAIIFPTSTPLIGGLRGRRTKLWNWFRDWKRKSTNKPDSRRSKEYVYISKSKSSLRNIIRKSTKHRTLPPTGMSITPTRALVLRSPTIKSIMIKAKNRAISTATDAGKPTELKPISELTPKHARRINRIPIGTYSHAVRFLCHVRRVT